MASEASYKPQFYVVGLAVAEADDAYHLIRAIAPEVGPNEWRNYVRRRCRDGGFKGLFDENGLLVGLFSYRLGERLKLGRVLVLDDFVTFELSRLAPGRKLLMAMAEKLALQMGCSGFEVRIGSRGVADPGTDKAGGWLGLGMDLDSVVFVKSLDQH